jgi:uncharacterized repeat protein (TIGR03803 family)
VHDKENVMNYRRFLGAASAALMIVIVVTLMLAPGAWAASKDKTLYKFTGAPDGANPESRLTFDQAGNLYGTTEIGGTNNAGTVFESPPTRTEAGPRAGSTAST